MRAGSGRTGGEDEVLRLVREHAAELLRFARRLSICDDDAHDAYQRAVEILVRRMRTAPPEQPLSWMRTVIRHEATAVRTQREQLVGRREVDLDRHEARHLEDPADRVVGFERLRQTAEALQRLKPQEVTALLMRAEGLTYEEIGARTAWSATKVNRCVTEGRRALLQRLGAIESGAECERWLPLLSLLADGEAGAIELAELRPHLRACAGCRATLRSFHDAPRAVAAVVPPALALGLGVHPPGTLARHAEALAHALLERTTLGVARLQGALDALPGAKLAAIAASGAALAGGGVAISQATSSPARPAPAHEAAAVRAGTGFAPASLTAQLSAARVPAPSQTASAAEFAQADGSAPGIAPSGEFALEAEAPSRGAAGAPRAHGAGPSSGVVVARAPRAGASAEARTAAAFASPAVSPDPSGAAAPTSSRTSSGRRTPAASSQRAEFAGP